MWQTQSEPIHVFIRDGPNINYHQKECLLFDLQHLYSISLTRSRLGSFKLIGKSHIMIGSRGFLHGLR